MPPKRAARRGGGRPKGSASRAEDFETLLDLSPGPPLPSVPTQASWNYGAAGPAALPRRMVPPPKMDLPRMAQTIDASLEAARKRDPTPTKNTTQASGESPINTRLVRRSAPNSSSPVRRRPKREPTPDETQLLESLRDATVSPEREHGNDLRSDVTPIPPVPHTVSTDSSPAVQPPLQRRLSMLSNSPLYPSALQRAGSPQHDVPVGNTPDRHSSVDNASEVSWNLERHIHEDDLQRTRPGKYRGEQHGRNITAPPRRPSGLAIVHETIEEEDEPISEQTDEPEQVVEPAVQSAPETWTAPARTIIPQLFRSESASGSPNPTAPKDGLVHRWLGSMRPESRDGQPTELYRTSWVRVVAILLLSLFLVLSFRSGFPEMLRSSLSFGEPSLDFAPNSTESEVVHGLRNHVSRMHAQMSSLSRELISVRSEHARNPVPTYIPDTIAVPRRPVHKVNFLSRSLGAIVDPDNTTPTAGPKHSFYKRVLLNIFGFRSTLWGPQPPAAALAPWEEIGDCWCSAPRNGVTQLSVLLGRDIVPEEVVVEHIPAGAALDPGVAPREIEMWARFRIVPFEAHREAPARSSYSWFSTFVPGWSSETSRPSEPDSSRNEGLGGYNIPGEKSLHDVLMNSLHLYSTSEPETAYSDDPFLGPNFYRVGKMEYDIHKSEHVQAFHLNTVIDIPTIRVDKVAFRVKSNWGSNHTCIYRFKLHGHV